jgi:uncharacterized membrane protein YeiH
VSTTLGELSRAIDLAGVSANAGLGGFVARELEMDPVGFVALAIVSGLGGGILRDTLLQHGPSVALVDPSYLLCATAAAALAFVVPMRGWLWSLSYPVVDALALGPWAAVGAEKTLAVGLSWIPAVLLGTISAVGGGALRDVIVGRRPQIFGGNTLYATCAAASSLVVVLFSHHGTASEVSLLAAVIGTGLCLLSRWRGWRLGSGLSWNQSTPSGDGKRDTGRTVRFRGLHGMHRQVPSDTTTGQRPEV